MCNQIASHTRWLWRILCTAVLLACPLGAYAAESTPLPTPEASRVIARLKTVAEQAQTLDCTFIQEKQLSLFARTVKSEGRMVFQRPDSLRWEYTKPISSGFLMHGGKGMSWSNAGGVTQRLQLKDNKEFAALAHQILPWLSFDEPALRQQYSIDVLNASPAVLRLTPHNETIRRFLLHLTIRFAPDDSAAEEVRIQEAGGDSTTIRFLTPKRNVPVPPALFSL